MNKISALENRIKSLEVLFNESKIDQERLLNFLGKEYYDKYLLIKNKIKDSEYKDIYKLMKKDIDEVKDFIDSFKSNLDIKRDDKSGAKLLYNKDGWKVYRITSYKAAQIYGRNTKWCITGNYSGHEEKGEEYFYSYIEDYDLDGGYYFYIKSNNEKYCILQTVDNEIESIWNIQDDQIEANTLPNDFPVVKEVNLDIVKSRLAAMLRSGNPDKIKYALSQGISPDDKIGLNSDSIFEEMLFDFTIDELPLRYIQTLIDVAHVDINKPYKTCNYLAFATAMSYFDWQHVQLVKFLIRNGINLNSKESVNSVFKILVHKPNAPEVVEILEILVENGYDIDNENEKGETLYDVAVKKKADNVIEFIYDL